MKLGKYSIYLLIYFFLNLNQSFGETTSNIIIKNLDELPSTYEEEEFIDEDNNTQHLPYHLFNDHLNKLKTPCYNCVYVNTTFSK